MNRADPIDRLDKILRTYADVHFNDDGSAWQDDPVDAETLIDDLERDGLEIVRK